MCLNSADALFQRIRLYNITMFIKLITQGFFLPFLFIFAFSVNAQEIVPNERLFSIKTETDTPNINSSISVELEDIDRNDPILENVIEGTFARLNDIDSINWKLNGVDIPELKDEDKGELPVGSEIGLNLISAEISFQNLTGETEVVVIEKNITPILFEVYIEGETVSPPRYLGRNLPSGNSPITFSSLIRYKDVSGVLRTEKDFNFEWSLSGRGVFGSKRQASTITIEEGFRYIQSPVKLSANAVYKNNVNVTLSKTVYAELVIPRLLKYESDLLNGLKTERVIASGDFITSTPVTISLYPLYFSQSSFLKGDLIYNWYVGRNISPTKQGRKIDIDLEGESSEIDFRVEVLNQNKNEYKIPTESRFKLRL